MDTDAWKDIDLVLNLVDFAGVVACVTGLCIHHVVEV
jgi:hypothetical protein